VCEAIGAQDVRQDRRVATVGLAAGDGVAFPGAVDGEGVAGIDGAAGRPESGDQQAAVGFDRDRNRILRRVAVVGEQFERREMAGEVVNQTTLG
jgi:hypothetical protein